jgi:amino acid transporter
MTDIMYDFQPTVYALIGVGTLLFFSYPRQIKKWEQEPPKLVKISPLRRLMTIVFGLAFAGVFSIMLSPNGSYAIKNFLIICVIFALEIAITVYGVKKYSKNSNKLD